MIMKCMHYTVLVLQISTSKYRYFCYIILNNLARGMAAATQENLDPQAIA